MIGRLEELRDNKLSSIFKLIQSRMRGMLMRREYHKMIERKYVHADRPVNTVDKDSAVSAEGLEFESRAGQISQRVANGSPPLRRS